MKTQSAFANIISFLLVSCFLNSVSGAEARIGSKIFTEGYVLAEILAVHLESGNFPVKRLGGLGATGITEAAMKNKEIDLIVDYSGSVTKAFLKSDENLSNEEMQKRLKPLGFVISRPLGFNNTYALATTRTWTQKMGVSRISDLKKLSQVKAAFTPEFTERKENWPGLKDLYRLSQVEVNQMDHQLAYEALKSRKVDIIEAYSTDAKIKQYDLMILEDDLQHFPRYDGIIMSHLDWVEKNEAAWKHLLKLEGKFSDEIMTELNSQADIEKKSFTEIARNFLNVRAGGNETSRWTSILQAAQEHIILVVLPVLIALLLGWPLAFFSYRIPAAHTALGIVASSFQTIPSLAFLALLVPLFGIGGAPAIVVLSIYALLPIYLSAFQGFKAFTKEQEFICMTLKLKPWFQFRKIQWPISWPYLIVGLQTAVISTVGTATLAALIGAGGYGKMIIAGLAVNDPQTILMGAVPAAAMAILFQLGFERLQRRITRG